LSKMQVWLVRRSFGKIAVRPEVIARGFYGRLFTLNPEVRPLFRHDMKMQGQKLMEMLAILITELDNPEYLQKVCADLGARHQRYGITAEHFAAVGDALIWALEQYLGSDFTPPVRDAWAALYDAVADMVLYPRVGEF
jgi:hemoglobin-like flavoprotein